MEDWCKTCKYIDIDGADLPCGDCIVERSMPTEYTPKRQAVRELLDDLDAMEEGMSRTADRADIWQDRLIYAMCKAIYHIIKWIVRKEKDR
jgi:hypothetical protein